MAATVGGVLSGVNPFHYNASSPITLFLIQVCIILLLSNGLHLFLTKLRQPKVISEVIAGVILGPTALGQIPNYTNTLFPKASVTGLNLVANLGIILFMFFLGLEVDVHFIKNHAKTAFTVGLATLAIPFGFGCLFSIPLFNTYMKGHDVKFTVFMVFIAVSLSVTAFPVLCRILAELRLLRERVGIVVLAAGTINDVIGWILLALCIILSNSQSKPVNVVYILLCTLGWFLVYAYPVSYALRWTLLRIHEFERSKPSTRSTLLILILTIVSAYFTDIIGVHPIFGAFMAGLIVPRDNNYVVKLADRMEDLPNIVMIPIYFTIAGLNVDLTKLNSGEDWGFTFASIGIAVSTKLLSGFLMSKLNGLFWRESLAVGVLMSCKGIVEIVVLTTGLNAGIISTKVYSMFIFMALISTFITTPLTIWIFPASYREELKSYLKNSEDGSQQNRSDIDGGSFTSLSDMESCRIDRIVTVLNKPESVFFTISLLNYLVNGNKLAQSRKTNVELDAHSNMALSNDTARDHSHVKDPSDDGCFGQRVTCDNVIQSMQLKTVYFRLLTDRTTDLLQNLPSADHRRLAKDYSGDSCLEILNMFSELVNVTHSGDLIFSLLGDKNSHINEIPTGNSDLILFPMNGISAVPSEKFKDCLANMLAQNELEENFFQFVASNARSNMAFLISNAQSKTSMNTPKRTHFYFLLPDMFLTSSDHLTLHLLLLVLFAISDAPLIESRLIIYVNKCNSDFVTHFFSHYKVARGRAEIVSIDLQEQRSSHEELPSDSGFIDIVLERIAENDDSNFESSLVLIADSSFSQVKSFNHEVEVAIMRSFTKHFDLLVCHNGQK